MNAEGESPFQSLESAHEFVALLAEAVAETQRELEADIEREAKGSRRLDAQRVVLYNLEKLELHMYRSRRILNDLRTLRRLLFEERRAIVPLPSKSSSSEKMSVAA